MSSVMVPEGCHAGHNKRSFRNLEPNAKLMSLLQALLRQWRII